MVGDKEWRTVDDSLSVKVARKYAQGGITDGIEVSWKKKKDLPPELQAALGVAGIQEPEPEEQTPTGVIDLLKNPIIRRNTIMDSSSGLRDGVTMQWSKNSKFFFSM
jgi:hypothetical protein